MNTTKNLITLMLALVLPGTAVALQPYNYDNYEFEVDGIYYIIKDNAAWVTFQRMFDGMHLSDYHGDVVIPSTVDYQDKTYPVTTIDNYAFNYCEGLTSITIPESIKTIGYSAFFDCTGLTRVTITDIEAWCRCNILGHDSNPLIYAHHLYLNDTEVIDLIIPESITKIGNFVFEGCSGLTSVTIPNTVTSIGDNAFEGCSGLTSIVIPNSVTEIGAVAFEGCTGLTSVTLGNLVSMINISAFSGCAGITSIKIPKTVTAIGANAFNGCSGLTSIDIPDLVTEIGGMAFYNCTGLTSVSIGKSVTSIGNNAFNNTPSIERVTCKATTPPSWYNTNMFTTNVYNHAPLYVPKGSERAYKTCEWGQFSTIIGVDWEQGMGADVVVDGIYYVLNEEKATATVTNYDNGPSQTAGTDYSGDIIIPETITTEAGKTYTVTAIGDYAFMECTLLSSITMPNSITDIGRRAFMGCTELESVELPNSLTSIGERAFEACAKLMSFDFPNSLKSIGESAFSRTGWYDLQPDGLVYAGTVAYHYKGSIPEDTHLFIQEGTTSIADAAFLADEKYYYGIDNYEGLLSVDIPNSVKYIGNYVFLDDCTNLQQVTIGSGVEDMGNCSFAWIPNLTDVTICEGVKLIGKQMFSGCPNLKKIIIPNSVEVIKYRAFAAEEEEEYGYIEEPACISLTDVTIGSGVKSIEQYAFSGCAALTKITCLATTPPSLQAESFDEQCYATATLYVPAEAVDLYKADPYWGQFLNISADVTREAYAVFTEADSTLTFFYDELRSTRSGTTYDLNTGDNTPDWFENRYNVSHVTFDPSFAAARPTSTYLWFVEMINIPSVTGIEHLNTSDVTNMAGMFANCESLSTLDLSGFNTENVQNMERMFNGCRILTTLDLSSFNTSNVTRMCQMFSNCGALASLDLSGFNTSNVTTMSGMFHSCRSLVTLDLSGFNTSNVTDMGGMFSGCNHLETIFASNNWSTVALTYSDYMFYGCASLVGGQGTAYDENHVDAAYAHIDGGPSNPGYFTEKGMLIPGDVNGDGTVNISDANGVIDIVIMGGNGGHTRIPAADANGDGTVNVSDLNYIIDIILSKN